MRDDRTVEVQAEPVVPRDPERFAHLARHRGLIVRRALLASAIRGLLPVPMLDDVLAGRVRAGLYAKLASGWQVDVRPEPTAILANARGQGMASKLTLAAAAAVIARFAGRKFLALAVAGRGAEEMAMLFHDAALFDHYCAKLHVGGEISTDQAKRLRACLAVGKGDVSLAPTLAAFAEGSRILGRTVMEAPRWLAQRIAALGERFVRSGGNPDVLDAFPEQASDDDAWLDRAARAVEEALARAGNDHLERMIRGFEERWQAGEESRKSAHRLRSAARFASMAVT